MTDADALIALKNVRTLIGVPQAWTYGAMARNINGAVVCSTSETAVSWSLLGAMNYVTRLMARMHPTAQVVELVEMLGLIDVETARSENDAIGWSGVVRLLNEKIAELGG